MGQPKRGRVIATAVGAALVATVGVWVFTSREKIEAWYEHWKLLRDPTAWKTYEGHRYILTPGPGTWYEAEEYARSLGGNLVTVNDSKEQDWLVEVFGRSTRFWIGCTDRKVEGRWTTANGEPLPFENWFPGEPTNDSGDDNHPEHFAVMNHRNHGKWNDVGEANSEWGTTYGIVELAD